MAQPKHKEPKSFFRPDRMEQRYQMAQSKHEKPKIINLSKKTLTTDQIIILAKGLKFTPTPQTSNYNEIKDDISDFCRKLRLTEEFFDKNNDDESIVKNKSKYYPPKGRNKELDIFCDHITNFPYELLPKHRKYSNFRATEWESINILKNDSELIIKEADKGSAVVIMDIDFYKNLILSMLEDYNYYEKINNYNHQKIIQKLITLVNSYRKDLTDKEYKYITDFNSKTSNFYGLPKIHKSNIISNACKESPSVCVNTLRPNDLKLRPIVAGPSCETHRLSNFLDILLQPFLKHIQSFIRDDLDLLNHLPHTVNEKTLMVSFDVTNLYTNVPHEYGLEAILFWLNKCPHELPDRIEKEFIIEGLNFILKNNFFNFDETVYRQKSGTAMGTKMAPSYINLVMGYLEMEIYERSMQQYGDHFHKYLKENWKRYLDDCFILWKEGLDRLSEFKILINSINNNIQFTMEYDRDKLPFLDILVLKNLNRIETDIYYKPTDSKQYLLFTSCHPKHTRINIPFNLAKRICTIVSNPDTRKQRLLELRDILIERRYPPSLIDNGIERAEAIDISVLRTTKCKSRINVLPYISTHNPQNTEVFTIIHENLPLLNQNLRMRRALENQKIIKSKRQPKSLKKLLTNAQLPTQVVLNPTVTRCGRSNCGICINLSEGPDFLFKTGHLFKIKNNFTCSSKNLIYVITCCGCSENYIGQTSMTLRRRMTVHRQQIRDPGTRQIPLSGHLSWCAGSKIPMFKLFPFYQCTENVIDQQRLSKEAFFIKKYKPSLNNLSTT